MYRLGDVRLLEFFLRHHGVIAAAHRNSKVLNCISDLSLIQHERPSHSSQLGPYTNVNKSRMAEQTPTQAPPASTTRKRILLNGFDMFTVGHLSFGQWKHPADRAATKRRDLSYWTDLARILEKGDFNALFLADSFGLHETYQGGPDTAIRNATQFPMGDPSIVRFTMSL